MSEYRDEMQCRLFGIEFESWQINNYTSPKSTTTDHLRDCFGWVWQEIKPYRNKALSQYSRMMVNAFDLGSSVPSTTGFLIEQGTTVFMGKDEKVEIDIVRGNRTC